MLGSPVMLFIYLGCLVTAAQDAAEIQAAAALSQDDYEPDGRHSNRVSQSSEAVRTAAGTLLRLTADDRAAIRSATWPA